MTTARANLDALAPPKQSRDFYIVAGDTDFTPIFDTLDAAERYARMLAHVYPDGVHYVFRVSPDHPLFSFTGSSGHA